MYRLTDSGVSSNALSLDTNYPYTIAGTIYDGIFLMNGYVYFGSTNNNVYCIDTNVTIPVAKSGWPKAVTGEIRCRMARYGTLLFVVTTTGKIYAFTQ